MFNRTVVAALGLPVDLFSAFATPCDQKAFHNIALMLSVAART
jgi:hypothetical protein